MFLIIILLVFYILIDKLYFKENFTINFQNNLKTKCKCHIIKNDKKNIKNDKKKILNSNKINYNHNKNNKENFIISNKIDENKSFIDKNKKKTAQELFESKFLYKIIPLN